jgi:hypothetical protein
MSETTELSELVASTRSDLYQIIEALRVQDRLLLALAERLPTETGEEDLEEMAEHVELRAVILCVAKDCVQPAIEDLLAVVEEKR